MEDLDRLQQRLKRERIARVEAERIAEDTIRTLYDRQCDIQLLRAVAFAANQARTAADALRAALALVCEHSRWPVGHVLLVHDERLDTSGIWHDVGDRFLELRRHTDATAFGPGIGLPGQVLTRASPVWIEDVTTSGNFPRGRGVACIGVRAAFGVPVMVGTRVCAVLEFFREDPAPLDGKLLELMEQVGAMLGRVIEREHAHRELHDANNRLTIALHELREAQETVVQQERLRALGQMASGIAHDFNNALHPIVGYAELLRDMPAVAGAPGAGRFLANILTSATDAAAVVARLREFYRVREGDHVMQPIDLCGIAKQVVELTRPRWYNEALAGGVRLSVEMGLAPVPPVLGHAQELREAITNLLLNAIDAMPGGGTIALRTREQDGRVVLDVRDTGTGMTEEVRRQCLEPFFTTKGDRGSGLGLGMVYGIVQRHEGTLDIVSAPGQGTTITLSFPVGEVGEAAAPEAVTPTRDAHRLRILVVDDKEPARELVKDLLDADGHDVVTAINGVDAMAHLSTDRVDVVVTDRSMPGMSGDELARNVKQSERPVPVVMITGFGVLMVSAGERPLGVDIVLPKPVTRAMLREALSAVQPAAR